MSRISGSGTGSFATAVDIGSKSWPFVIAPEPRYTHRRAELPGTLPAADALPSIGPSRE